MYKFPVIELVDRYCIAKLKFAKLGNIDIIHKSIKMNWKILVTVVDLDTTQ
jgi:hypothetical protein